MKKSIFSAAAACSFMHLLLVTMGASSVDFDALGSLGEVLDYYGEISGSSRSYGFFAPGIGKEVAARFEVINHAGERATATILTGHSHEADVRISNIVDQFAAIDGDAEDAEDVRRSLAASLAGSVMGQQPDAMEVVVHLDEFAPVSMPAWRGGARPDWAEIYTARFRRAGAATAEVNP